MAELRKHERGANVFDLQAIRRRQANPDTPKESDPTMLMARVREIELLLADDPECTDENVAAMRDAFNSTFHPAYEHIIARTYGDDAIVKERGPYYLAAARLYKELQEKPRT